MKLHVASPRCRLFPGDVRDEFEFGVFLGCQSCQLYTGSWELNFAMLCTYETSVSFGMSRQQVEKLLLIIRISTCCDTQRAEYSCLQHANDGGALHESLASSSSHCPAPALLGSPASTGTGKSSDLGHEFAYTDLQLGLRSPMADIQEHGCKCRRHLARSAGGRPVARLATFAQA